MLSPTTPALNADTASDTDWLKPGLFAALLGLLVFASFPQVVLGLQTFVYRDFGYFGYPLAHYFRESIWRGELPLWNPLNNCGLPFLAQWNTQVLYPLAYFYVLFPLSWSLGVFCLLHLVLGGLGMYFLALRWTNHRLAAAVAGTVFAFNGLMFNSLMWPNNIAALGWLPWVVWLVERAWNEGGRSLLLAALAGAMQMLAGAPEIVLYTWGFLGLLMVGELLRRDTPRAKVLVRFCVVVVLIGGLAAAQLLPFLDLLTYSHRQETFSATDWPMPITGWGNFLLPLFHCHRSYHGVFLQTDQYRHPSYYVGVATVALAMGALWRVCRGRVWLLAALVLFCLVMAFGDATPLYRWLSRHVPLLTLMRFPVKFVILPVFALPLLAAFALSGNQNGDGSKTVPWGRRWWVLWLVVTTLLGGIVWLAYRFPHPYDNWPATWRNGVARGLFFTAIIGILFAAEKISRIKLRRLLQLALLLLIWLDLSRHAPLSQTVSRAIYEPDLPRSLPTPQLGASRAMISGAARTGLALSQIPDVTEDYVSRRFALFCNCNLLDHIPKVEGFFSLYLREQMQIFALLYGHTNAPPSALLDFIGVSMITSATNFFDWTPRTTFLPLLTAGQQPIFADAQTSLRHLAGTNFNPRLEVLLPLEAQALVAVTNGTAAKISAQQFAAHRIGFEVEADAPALAVIAQTFYHPWRAYVDGTPTRLWRANQGFQAVEVPAGRHRVELVYVDRMFHGGATISLATLAGCLLFLRRGIRRATRQPGPLSQGPAYGLFAGVPGG